MNLKKLYLSGVAALIAVSALFSSCKDERPQGDYTHSDGDSDSLTEIITGADVTTIPDGGTTEDKMKTIKDKYLVVGAVLPVSR